MKSVNIFLTYRFLLILAALLSVPAGIKAQENIHFDHISVEQGLSQGSVRCILQDRSGFMWFGTQDGLNRYDGISIKSYRNNPLDSTTISDNFITSVVEDFEGNLWIGTQNGLNKLGNGLQSFKRYFLRSHDTTEQTISITCLMIERENQGDSTSAPILWIGTLSGLFRFNIRTERIDQFQHEPNNDSTLTQNSIRTILRDHQGNLWIGTDLGLNKKIGSTDRFAPFCARADDSLNVMSSNVSQVFEDSKKRVWVLGRFITMYIEHTSSGDNIHTFPARLYSGSDSIFARAMITMTEDRLGNFWLATGGWGVIKMTLNGEKTPTVSIFLPEDSNPFGISSDYVLSMYLDRSNLLWFGTFGKGINKVNASNPKFRVYRHYPGNPHSLCTESIRGIYEDEHNILWTGGYNNLNAFDRTKELCTVVNINVRNIYAVHADPCNSNILWIGTEGGGLRRYNKKNDSTRIYMHNQADTNGISGDWVNSIYTEPDGTLWVGTNGGYIDRVTQLPSGQLLFKHFFLYNIDSASAWTWLNTITKDKSGIIWAGTQGKGLFSIDPKFPTGNVRAYLSDPGNPKRLGSNRIKVVYEDSRGILWVGTDGGGLNKYNREDDSFKRYTEYEGLPNNVVYGILEDSTGNLWLSTNKGLSKFNPVTGTFKNYDVNDGLQSNEFNSGSYYMCKHGEMFFGGVSGLNAFFPGEVKENQHIPQIAFTSFKKFNEEVVFDRPINFLENITLSYSENFISFEFAALEYTSPLKNQYAYKMEGFDDDWVYTGNKNSATFTNLDPGEYTFRVKASNNDGVWNTEGASIVLIIKPPIWATWWFRGFMIAGFLSIAFTVVYIRIKRLERENRIIEEFSRKVITELENERKRVAGEIHDGLGQYLLVVKNRAEIGARNSPHEQKLHAQFQQISIAATEAIKESRQISHNLRPYQLDRLGLADAIRSMLEKARETSLINFTGSIDDINNLFENKDVEIHLYRIIQESVNNILKHSSATTARIVIERKEREVVLLIEDNGVGFDSLVHTPTQQGGMGMSTMTERIRIIHGISSFQSSRNEGTKLEVRIPIKTE